MPGQQITTMQPSEVEIAIGWAADEGWNPGLHDAPVYHQTDPNGFFLGRVDGEPASCISAIAYDGAYGFIGFYIVRPDLRGQGLGIDSWRHAMAYIGLDGVVAQQENYKRSGFSLAYRNLRYRGAGSGQAGTSGESIRMLRPEDLGTVAAYDRRMYPAERPRFLERWVALPESKALGLFAGPALEGYAVMRRCRTGYRIGPLFANTPDAAAALLGELRSGLGPEDEVFIDVPEVNRPAVKLAEDSGMTTMFETARMYSRGTPDIDLDRIYGVSTLELG